MSAAPSNQWPFANHPLCSGPDRYEVTLQNGEILITKCIIKSPGGPPRILLCRDMAFTLKTHTKTHEEKPDEILYQREHKFGKLRS